MRRSLLSQPIRRSLLSQPMRRSLLSQPMRRSLLSQPMRRALLCVLLKLLGGRELLGVHAPHALCRSSRAWLG